MIRRYSMHAAFLALLVVLVLSSGPVAAQTAPASGDSEISLDFNDVDIRTFVKYMSEVTGRNFIIDNRVKGKVTVVSPEKVDREKAWDVFESVLEVHGYGAVVTGNVVKVVTLPEARTKAVKMAIGEVPETSDQMMTRLIPLQFADPKELKRLLAPLVSKTSSILAYPASNMLIVTDISSNIDRLLEIVKAIDVLDMGREITLVPLHHADASTLVKTLEQVFKQSKQKNEGNVTEETVKLIADERTNSLVMVASAVDSRRVMGLITALDKAVPKGKERIHVRYLENAKAEELEAVLNSLTSKSGKNGNKAKKTGPLVSSDVVVSADKSTNSLIIMANKNDFAVLEEVINGLDVPRTMVLIECLIAELNLESGFGLGVEWTLGDSFELDGNDAAVGGGFSGTGGNTAWSNLGSVAANGRYPSGFSVGVLSAPITLSAGGTSVTVPRVGALINAFKSNKDVQILSTPQITTLENEEASITVGRNIPYLIKSSTGDNAYNNYEYKDVGIQLKITPQISEDGLIRLEVFQEVTRLDTVAGDLGELPTTFKRSLDTTVLVRDLNTVVIGGLIDESLSKNEYKVPCLGDIPVVGHLFRSDSKGDAKTNLFVFLTPRIIRNSEDSARITSKKKAIIEELTPQVVKMFPGADEADGVTGDEKDEIGEIIEQVGEPDA